MAKKKTPELSKEEVSKKVKEIQDKHYAIDNERAKIFKALRSYVRKHDAECYCVVITPSGNRKVTFVRPINQNISTVSAGDIGAIIKRIVERVLLPTEKNRLLFPKKPIPRL